MIKTAEVFDKNWEKYENWFEEHGETYSAELEALRRALPAGFSLEIGVGSGRFAFPLGVKTGIDPSKNMLMIAKKRGIEVIQGVGESLPFKDSAFDYILIVVTLCFVENPEKVLVEAVRVLKRGGRLIVGEINKDSELGRLYEAKRKKSEFYKLANFYSSDEIIEMLDKVGIRYLESYQTLLHSPTLPEMREKPKKGFDDGGFVVIVGEKINQSSRM